MTDWDLLAQRRAQPTWVYRMYDANGALLYIGQTRVPQMRLSVWRSVCFAGQAPARPSAAWFANVVRIDWRKYPDWTAATAAERHAIATEHPRHNRMHRRAA